MRIRLTAVALVVAIVGAGCASIPNEGAVHNAPAEPEEPVPSVFDPPGPKPGASPEEIVEGFITAMKAQPITSDAAREFLTDGAIDQWEPKKQTVVFSDKVITSADNAKVELVLDTYATLGRRGAFTPTHGDDRAVDLELKKENGQWRISNPPDAYLIDETQFEEHYQAISLYFVADSHRFAVPEPVYLPVGDQLPTYAMNALLRGPGDDLGSVVTSYLPEDSGLDVSVRVDDEGVAEVRLIGEFEDLDVDARQAMSAQIVLTLGQVPGVEGVRILVDGVTYEVSGSEEVQPITSWNGYDPSVSPSPTTLYAMRQGQLVVVEDDNMHAFAGPWEGSRADIGDFGIDADENRIAVVDKSRKSVDVRSLAVNDEQSQEVLNGTNLLSPQWDSLDWLWVVDAQRTSTSIAAWHDGDLRPIPIGDLAGMRVSGFSVSPDGARFAAVAAPPNSKSPEKDEALYVGHVRRKPDGNAPMEVVAMRRVPIEPDSLRDIRSIAWRDATHLVALAARGSNNVQPYMVAIDGSSISGGAAVGQTGLPGVGASSVAASGRISDPIYVADNDGGLWKLDTNQRWIDIGDAKIQIAHYAG